MEKMIDEIKISIVVDEKYKIDNICNEINERIKELSDQLREDESKGHIASLISGEIDGLNWALNIIRNA